MNRMKGNNQKKKKKWLICKEIGYDFFLKLKPNYQRRNLKTK